MFTTDEDQKQHLEKEVHGQIRDEETTEEKQEKLDESHPRHIWQTKNNVYWYRQQVKIKNNNNNKYVLRSVLQIILYILKRFNWSKS